MKRKDMMNLQDEDIEKMTFGDWHVLTTAMLQEIMKKQDEIEERMKPRSVTGVR